jgi:uncharacterized protein YegL
MPGLISDSPFNDGWMCPTYKKNNKSDIANYRPITVLITDYKPMTKAAQAKVAKIAPDLIHPNQAGFMKDRSRINHIHTIRVRCQNGQKYQRTQKVQY